MKDKGRVELLWTIALPVTVLLIVGVIAFQSRNGVLDYAPGYADSPGYVVFDHAGDRVVNGKLADSKRVTKLRSFLDKMDGVTVHGKYGSVSDKSKVFGIAFTGDSGKVTSRYAVHKEKGVWHVYRMGKRLGKMELKTSESDRKKLDAMVMDVLGDKN